MLLILTMRTRESIEFAEFTQEIEMTEESELIRQIDETEEFCCCCLEESRAHKLQR